MTNQSRFSLRWAVAIAGVIVSLAAAQSVHRLAAGPGRFELDGQPLQIISGEMHYPRVPPEYWRDRMRKARAMGLNTISTYVFWNYHEAAPGRYDFSGPRDVAAYIRTAQEEGLHVILRPGPYVCAEWDLGGYPAWLFASPDIVLRSTDPKFTAPAARWLDRLGQELTPLLASRGGPIIAVQVENEYGSFDKDKAYMTWQRDALRHAGFGDALLYTADGPGQLPDGTLPDLPAVVNFGTGGADGGFRRLAAFRPDGPMMSGEYWAGWFDQWGGRHASTSGDRQTAELTWMLERGYSVNLYMFHGGTTFGFMNGANIDRGQYHPQTTSYDYDAALDESGRPTPKYFTFRDAITKRTGVTPPPVPETAATISIPEFRFTTVQPIVRSNLRAGVHVDRPRSMETFGQSYGYILYRTRLPDAVHADLVVSDVRDYAQIYLNLKLVATLDRRLSQDRVRIDTESPAQLDILVENGGRVNFAKALLEERKGITKSVILGEHELTGWDVFPQVIAADGPVTAIAEAVDGAARYGGTFTLTVVGDTFLDTRGWGKGVVWINGHELGRFWDIGPQQTLYVPGPWLNKGQNVVTVFALTAPDKRTMTGMRAPILK